jgi:hypothetical protein
LNITFRNIKHILHILLGSEDGSPAYSLRLLNYPLIVRNVINAQNILDMETMRVPDKLSNICRLIQDNFPVITLKEFYDSKESFEKYVTREVISLYYLFFILKELRNLPFSLPTIKKTKVEGAKKSKH